MKIVITGGGTGGHVFPALVVANRLRKENHQIYYFGNPGCIELELCKKEDIPFYAISSKSTLKKDASFFLQNSKGVLKAISHLKKIKPDIIYSTGGYTTAPVISAAKVLGIPFVLHEQNAVIGMVNRLFRNSSKHFLHSFPYEQKEGERVIGNLSRFPEVASRDEQYIVFMGGSGGASVINDLATRYAKHNPKKQVLLLAGRNYQVQEVVENLTVYPFVENMLDVLSKAEIVVARAGSTTLAELSSQGIPSIIIPMPNSADNHQQKNAEYYEWKRAIIKVNQDEYVYETLCNAINRTNKKDKKTMSANFLKCYNSTSVNQIIELLTSR